MFYWLGTVCHSIATSGEATGATSTLHTIAGNYKHLHPYHILHLCIWHTINIPISNCHSFLYQRDIFLCFSQTLESMLTLTNSMAYGTQRFNYATTRAPLYIKMAGTMERVITLSITRNISTDMVSCWIEISWYSNCHIPSGSRSLVTPYSLSATWNAVSKRSRAIRERIERQSIKSGLETTNQLLNKTWWVKLITLSDTQK